MSAKRQTMSAEMDRAEGMEAGCLGDLYVRHAPDAIRLAYLLTGDRDLADDLVQEAFVKVARRLGHLRHPDAFGAYLRRTAELLRCRPGTVRALASRGMSSLRQDPREGVVVDGGGSRAGTPQCPWLSSGRCRTTDRRSSRPHSTETSSATAD